MRSLYELYSERASKFLHTWEQWRPGVYIIVIGESKSLQNRDLSSLEGSGTWGFQDFRVPFHIREIWVSNGFYLACYAKYFHVQAFVGTKSSHTWSVGLFSPYPHWFIEAPIRLLSQGCCSCSCHPGSSVCFCKANRPTGTVSFLAWCVQGH